MQDENDCGRCRQYRETSYTCIWPWRAHHVFVGRKKLLNSCRDPWAGKTLFLFQPNEKRECGAQAMVDDGSQNVG
jgi:hypothetical protein